MAASRCRLLQSLFSHLKSSSIRWKEVPKTYSQYAPCYVAPLVDRKQIDKMLLNIPPEELDLMKVRAAGAHETCSVFYDPVVGKFINYVMRKGKKETARKLVEKAFTFIKHTQLRKYMAEKDENKRSEILLSPRDVLHQAIRNATPRLNVSRIKKSGTWYDVPVGITPRVARIFAMKWIVTGAKDKNHTQRLWQMLAQEILQGSQGRGRAVNKKMELHKLCEANRGYSNYKWT